MRSQIPSVEVLLEAAEMPRPIVASAPSETKIETNLADFRAIFEAECNYVWTTLRRLGVHERDVEDVAHETFLRVSAHLATYDPKRPARAWLFVFVLRMARDYRRLARHRHEQLGLDEDETHARDHAPTSAPQDIAMSARDTHHLVQRALDSLDWDKRVVFVACELDEREVLEVAVSLGIPRNTAASRLRAARIEFTAAVRRLAGGRP
jgi:RNA polymerase sigma-70 factor (ECF subfamily)